MGRPPIGQHTVVRLSAEMLARIDRLTKPRGRAEFIRDAVEEKLDRLDAQADYVGLEIDLLALPPREIVALLHRYLDPLFKLMSKTQRVDRNTPEPDFVVEMGSCGESGRSDVADRGSARDLRSG